MPLSLYNGEWNGGQSVPALKKYSWECTNSTTGTGRSSCVATDEAFFCAILKNGSAAGMLMFEQDYICSTSATTASHLGMGVRWFRSLDAAARAASPPVDVQLCSTCAGAAGDGAGAADSAAVTAADLSSAVMNPAHALASTLMRSASNGRGTGDHVVRNKRCLSNTVNS